MKCIACKRSIANGSRFCNRCGAAQPPSRTVLQEAAAPRKSKLARIQTELAIHKIQECMPEIETEIKRNQKEYAAGGGITIENFVFVSSPAKKYPLSFQV